MEHIQNQQKYDLHQRSSCHLSPTQPQPGGTTQLPPRLPQDAKDKIHHQMTFVHLIHNHHIKVIHLGGKPTNSTTIPPLKIDQTTEDDKQNIENTNIRYSIYMYIGNTCVMCVCVNFHVILHGICDLWNMICTIGWYIILLVPFTYKGFLAINCSTSGSLSNRRSRMPSVTKRILVFLGWPPSFGMPGTWLNPTASSFTPFSKNHPMHSLGFRLQKKKDRILIIQTQEF